MCVCLSVSLSRFLSLGLRLELGRRWDCECIVIPIIIGGLDVVSESFEKYKIMVPAEISMLMCTKITLLGSKKILRNFLARNQPYLLLLLISMGVPIWLVLAYILY